MLILGFLLVQAIVGLWTGSLALLSDAGHMATDALGLGMALAAIHAASRAGANPQRTFGLYRLEILAALANAVLLFGVAAYVLYEAVIRLGEDREIDWAPVLIVGLLGLAVNVVAFLLLRAGIEGEPERGGRLPGGAVRRRSARSASWWGAIVWGATGWTWVDPVIGAAIGVFILPRAFRLGREAVRILVQAAPARIDVPALRADLAGIPGVVDVHDLHVWTLDVGHGGGLGPPDGAIGHGQPRGARPGPGSPRAPSRRGPRHPPDRARRPPGLRRDHLVTAARSPERERWRRP